jgi:hypothetical protein
MKKLKISSDYTDAPGGRLITDGEYSGEDFREEVLRPLLASLGSDEILEINFDDSYGYPTSFLEEAFGGLAREIDSKELLKKMKFICNDEPSVIDRVLEYINNAKE